MPHVRSGPKVDSAHRSADALPTVVAGTVFSPSLRPLPSTATHVCVRLCASTPTTTMPRHFLALSAMHTTVRHLAPAWPCIVSRLATPTVSARRQVCGWTAADVRRRCDRQPRQLVSVSYPATRYTANR